MTDTIPQDTSLSDDVVERVALIAVEDMTRNGRLHHVGGVNMGYVHFSGSFDALRLVRVISAALKEAQNG